MRSLCTFAARGVQRSPVPSSSGAWLFTKTRIVLLGALAAPFVSLVFLSARAQAQVQGQPRGTQPSETQQRGTQLRGTQPRETESGSAQPRETEPGAAARTRRRPPAPAPSAGATGMSPSTPQAAPNNEAQPGVAGDKTRGSSAPSATSAPSDERPGVALQRPHWLFPDWPASSFQWGGYPVIGFRYVNDLETQIQTSTIEAGLGIQASGIPLKEGNPGASLAPQAGYALGFVTLAPKQGEKQSGVYHRVWGGFEVPILVKFTKTTLGIRYAQINGQKIEKSRMGGFTFDEGLLVLPFFATHYTLDLERVYEATWNEPGLQSQDHWLSLRFFTSFLNARFAIGPAITLTKFYLRDVSPTGERLTSTSLYADTRTDSLRAVAGTDLFWKIRATVDSRYILNVSRKSGGLIDDKTTKNAVRSPDKGLNDAPELPLAPEDSLLTSAFFGIKGLFGGLGFGYRYTLEVFDLNAREGRKTRKRESSGVGLFFDASL